MIEFIKKLFLSDLSSQKRTVHPAIKKQNSTLKAVWNDEKEKTFGIERLFRIFLVLSSYIFPGLYLRHLSGLYGLLSRKISLEIYVLMKLMIPIVIFKLDLQDFILIQELVAYLLTETLCYLLGLIFLSDVYSSPISNKRSYLMLMLNYAEVCLGFAVLYEGVGGIKGLVSSYDAIYYSFITATTIGYGDMSPVTKDAKILAIIHSMYIFVFIGLVLNNFTSNITHKNGTYRVRRAKKKTSKNVKG